MAVPKQRKSKARTRARKSQWKTEAPTYATCGRCRANIRPHHACSSCGWYKGRTVIETD